MPPSDPVRPVRSVSGNVTAVSNSGPASPSLTIGDIYYVLFRHKWKTIVCGFVGFGLAAAYYKLSPPPYQSDAKLFVRYVMESRTPGPAGGDSRVTSPDPRGDTILNSELEIITSLDLAGEVVDRIGADKFLSKTGTVNDRDRARFVLAKNLVAVVPPSSSIIHLVYTDPNPAVVQPVLREIIQCYLKKHVEIHRALGITGDFLTHETDQLRSRLAETEEELLKARNKIGVSSVEDAKKAYATQITQLRQEIFAAEADFAERSVTLQEMASRPPAPLEVTKDEPRPAQELINEYREIESRLAQLRHKEQELLTQFTPENIRVKEIREQVSEADQVKKAFEGANPSILTFQQPQRPPTSAGPTPANADVAIDSARLHALDSKIKVLHTQLEQLKSELSNIEQMEFPIQELRRKKDREEASYGYYSASLAQARTEEALGAGHVSNISEIQSPSPPLRDRAKSRKTAAMVGIAGIMVGLGWAFAIEFFFDRTIKRPVDVERILKLPLFISIPKVKRPGQLQLSSIAAKPKSNSAPPLPPGTSPQGTANSLAKVDLNLNHEKENDELYPFHETLRDRLIAYFESINLTHKPKLLAVTGLVRHSGVTTVAAGLAQCLSQTGEGNVLLVDMTAGQGSAQQFFKGKAICGIDELLDTRSHGRVQEKLYVVSEGSSNSDKLSRNLPQRFSKLIPKLKASDFDYIIFDMPPVSQISVTPRLAGLMDMVLLVIESEKTEREIVERAVALLAQSKAPMGAVLNKTKKYVPLSLHQDALSDV